MVSPSRARDSERVRRRQARRPLPSVCARHGRHDRARNPEGAANRRNSVFRINSPPLPRSSDNTGRTAVRPERPPTAKTHSPARWSALPSYASGRTEATAIGSSSTPPPGRNAGHTAARTNRAKYTSPCRRAGILKRTTRSSGSCGRTSQEGGRHGVGRVHGDLARTGIWVVHCGSMPTCPY